MSITRNKAKSKATGARKLFRDEDKDYNNKYSSPRAKRRLMSKILAKKK